ncbi:MFS general substrate transporter [Byssothecium circinans]|uniref:MFS general substrate transporter n=1 Tax=Byssothecium circinans TaxID=147558 RepID=A0A6A5TBH4_9PLEO|nr:MFS general substrate transporter [Byssothecium circinans]KAF1948126.1 MFS general substrate transporter [Byssothecium circinans]
MTLRVTMWHGNNPFDFMNLRIAVTHVYLPFRFVILQVTVPPSYIFSGFMTYHGRSKAFRRRNVLVEPLRGGSSIYSFVPTANADSGTSMKKETAQSERLNVTRASQDMVKPSSQDVTARSATDDQPFLLSGWKLQALIASLGLSMLLVGLDFTMVATAVPTITTEFNSLEDVSWYGSSFLIAICACQLLTGNFFAEFSHKVIFMIYVGIFLVGSVICGVAQSSAKLIVGRAVTGIGASGLLGGTLIVISTVVPKPQQPLYLGLVVSVYTSFWINLPIGGITLVTVLLSLNSRKHINEKRSVVTRLRSMDLAGFGYPWDSSVIIGLMVGFGVMLSTFIGWQCHLGDEASFPPKLFKKRTVCLGMFVYYLQIRFQTVMGASPLKSGIMYLPTGTFEIF